MIASRFRSSEYTQSELESYIQIISDVKLVDTESSFLDNLLHLIPIAGCPYFMNDTLVDLPSQLGIDNHTNDNRSYGFEVYGKKFTEKDYNNDGKIRLSAVNPAVVHNLEAQDPDLIAKIIEKIYVGTFDNCFLYDSIGDGVEIYGIQGNMVENGALHIPCKIGQRDVIGIADHAFDSFVGSQEVNLITIPASVQWLGNAAFSGLPMLQTVTFTGDSQLERIDDYCFSGCANLKNISLPENLKAIGDFAFSQCTSLETFEIGPEVIYVGPGTWRGCVNLSSITVDSKNEEYESIDGVLVSKVCRQLSAYPEAKKDSTYIVPGSILEVGPWAFAGNENLVAINLNQVETIRQFAFADCINLRIIIGRKVHSIEALAFRGTAWGNLSTDYHSVGDVLYSYTGTESSVDLSGYQAVSSYAFAFNNNIQEVKFGDNSSLICSFAFWGCTNLSSVFLNNSNGIIEIGDDAFRMTSDSIKFIVPDELKDEYMSSEMWQDHADSIMSTESLEEGGGGGEHEHADANGDGECDECGKRMSGDGSEGDGGSGNNNGGEGDQESDGYDGFSADPDYEEEYPDFGWNHWTGPGDSIYISPRIYRYNDLIVLATCIDDYSIFSGYDFKIVFLFEGNGAVIWDSIYKIDCVDSAGYVEFNFSLDELFAGGFGFKNVTFERIQGSGQILNPQFGIGGGFVLNENGEIVDKNGLDGNFLSSDHVGLSVGGSFYADDEFWNDPFSTLIVHFFLGIPDLEQRIQVEGGNEDDSASVLIDRIEVDWHSVDSGDYNNRVSGGYYCIPVRPFPGYLVANAYWKDGSEKIQKPYEIWQSGSMFYLYFNIDKFNSVMKVYDECNFVVELANEEDEYDPWAYPEVIINGDGNQVPEISYRFYWVENQFAWALYFYSDIPISEIWIEDHSFDEELVLNFYSRAMSGNIVLPQYLNSLDPSDFIILWIFVE